MAKRSPIFGIVLSAFVIAAYTFTNSQFRSSAPKVVDPPAPAVTVRVLDVGQGDAIYIRNGDSRAIVDGGPDDRRFGELLDSLGLNDTTIDVVILSHAHYDHYKGLQALFESKRNIQIRYFFENQDPSPASALATLRDSILARVDRGELVYRDTDDPCGDGRPICTITMKGGAKLHILKPLGPPQDANNRSVAVKLVGPDSTSFSMWLAGDAEQAEIRYFSRIGYPLHPGMRVDVLKANHHGSCNGVTAQYLRAVRPSWVIASLAAKNDYGHMHAQAKAAYKKAEVPWYRTDQNGTVTIRSAGTANSGYSIHVDRGEPNMNGPSDRAARQARCE
jgi:competence protein ComEC